MRSVEGHTDSAGPEVDNLELSAVLMRHGVPLRRLRAMRYGEARPIESNRTADGRARNHRVALVIGGPMLAGGR